MRLYLDNCCLNRPWDDQSRLRIHLEAEAVLYIVEMARLGKVELVTSDYLLAEILNQPDPVRCADVMALTAPASFHVLQTPSIDARALIVGAFSIRGYDALHPAAAEAAQCDFLTTSDDRFLRRCQRAGPGMKTGVLNPTGILSNLPA